MLAVEKDERLAGMLEEFAASEAAQELKGTLVIKTADVLGLDLEAEVARHRRALGLSPGTERGTSGEETEGGRSLLVSNLPYNVTTSVMRQVMPLWHVFESVTLMLQEEAAERFAEIDPGHPSYREATVWYRYYAEGEIAFYVSRKAFAPPPNVESAVLVSRLRRPEERVALPGSPREFHAFVRGAFAARRKMLRNTLGAMGYAKMAVGEAMESVGLQDKQRPDEVSLEDYAALHTALYSARVASDSDSMTASAGVEAIGDAAENDAEDEDDNAQLFELLTDSDSDEEEDWEDWGGADGEEQLLPPEPVSVEGFDLTEGMDEVELEALAAIRAAKLAREQQQ